MTAPRRNDSTGSGVATISDVSGLFLLAAIIALLSFHRCG